MSKQVAPLLLISILLLQLLHLSLQVQSSAVHYVKAEGGDEPCPTATPSTSLCQRLDFYMANASFYFASNTTLYFLTGEHVMLQSMVAVSVSNLTLQGLGSIDHDEYGVLPSTVISCSGPHSLVLLHSSDITVTGLTIKDCGGFLDVTNMDILQQYFDFLSLYYFNSPLALGFIEVVGLDITEVSIQNSTGYGLLAINALDANIVDCSFAKNNIHCANGDFDTDTNCYFGGNIAMLYTNLFDCASLAGGIYELNILHTNISLGYSQHMPHSSVHYSSGLNINLDHSPIYGMDVVLDDVVAYGNTAAFGGNVAFTVTLLVTYYTLTINNFKSIHSNMVHPSRPLTILGGGLLLSLGEFYFTSYQVCGEPQMGHTTGTISITNADLSENYGGSNSGGLNLIKRTNLFLCEEESIVITNVTFVHNIGYFGIGIFIVVNAPTSFLLQNVTVIGSAPFNNSFKKFGSSAILIVSVTNVTIEDVRVLHNKGTGFMLVDSLLVLKGIDNLIKGNRGNFGGGMSLFGNANILFDLPAEVRFVDNHAESKGGAIFVTKSFFNDICSFHILLPDIN